MNIKTNDNANILKYKVYIRILYINYLIDIIEDEYMIDYLYCQLERFARVYNHLLNVNNNSNRDKQL